MAENVLYGTSWCPYCDMARRYPEGSRVSFEEVDLERDHEAAHEVVRKTGQMGVPVLRIGESQIVGFGRPATKRAPADRSSREGSEREVSVQKEAER